MLVPMKMKNLCRKTLPGLLLLSALFSSGCATLGPAEPSDAEINVQAEKAYEEVKAKSKISTHAEWTAMVKRVSDRIAAASGENYKWEVILIDNPEPNAWCMPGGKMAVNTGIMPVLKTEAALAAVMGHEVAHATKSHGRKRYARAMQQNMIGLVVGAGAIIAGQALCKTKECKLLTALGGAAAGFAVAFFDRKFSRSDETEADQVGQLYMAKAGYDPSESIRLWERMNAAAGGKAPPEWLSTHPSDATRRENLTSWLPESQKAYASAPNKYGLGKNIPAQ
jgi:metalloendopeptidase OMA1, mitochondrial